MAKKRQERKLWDKVKYSLQNNYGYICSNPHSGRKKLREGFINPTFRTLRRCIFRINSSIDGHNDTINYKNFQAASEDAEVVSVKPIALSETRPALLLLRIHTSTSC